MTKKIALVYRGDNRLCREVERSFPEHIDRVISLSPDDPRLSDDDKRKEFVESLKGEEGIDFVVTDNTVNPYTSGKLVNVYNFFKSDSLGQWVEDITSVASFLKGKGYNPILNPYAIADHVGKVGDDSRSVIGELERKLSKEEAEKIEPKARKLATLMLDYRSIESDRLGEERLDDATCSYILSQLLDIPLLEYSEDTFTIKHFDDSNGGWSTGNVQKAIDNAMPMSRKPVLLVDHHVKLARGSKETGLKEIPKYVICPCNIADYDGYCGNAEWKSSELEMLDRYTPKVISELRKILTD